MSILFRPALAIAEAHLITTAVGVSAATACATVCGVEPRLKWPNDLVVASPAAPGAVRKVGGILAESIVEGTRLRAVVVGLGLNVNWPPDLPADLAEIAAALNHLAGREVDREDLLTALLAELDRWYGEIAAGPGEGSTRLMDEARARSATLGRRVRVELGGGVVEGDAVALTDDGALVVDVVVDGIPRPRVIVAGDVVHLRPA